MPREFLAAFCNKIYEKENTIKIKDAMDKGGFITAQRR